MYHLMYQDHLIIPSPGAFGPDIGHVISRDLVHWARLPVSIWNDEPYDENGIWTGSTTRSSTANRSSSTRAGARSGLTLPGASPPPITQWPCRLTRQTRHPTYTNWTKDKSEGISIATNPIVNGTSDDPSTAWQTPYGEWRLIGNAKAHGQN